MFATSSTRLMHQLTLIVVGFFIVITIFAFPFRYFQVKASGFDSKHLRYWRIDVPSMLYGQVHRFIKIVKEELGKNTKQ